MFEILLFTAVIILAVELVRNRAANQEYQKPRENKIQALLIALAFILFGLSLNKGGTVHAATSSLIFITAVSGGLMIMFMDWYKKQSPPVVIAVLNPLITVTALFFLVVYMLNF